MYQMAYVSVPILVYVAMQTFLNIGILDMRVSASIQCVHSFYMYFAISPWDRFSWGKGSNLEK